MTNKNKSSLLFLLGLFSATKIYFYGTLAISEAVIFFVTPLLFLKNVHTLKKDGFMGFVWMLGGLILSMLISSVCNNTPKPYILKEFAILYGWFCYFVVFHYLLRDNLNGLKYFLIGNVFSGFVIIFAFNPQATVDSLGSGYVGQADLADMIGGPLFWFEKITAVALMPIKCWYLQTPLVYSLVAPMGCGLFALFGSESARSGSLMMMAVVLFVIVGGKSRHGMRRIGRQFTMFVVAGLIGIICYKYAYSYAARNGMLSENATAKYYRQTARGSDIIHILMAGRQEFFLSLRAALDKPIIGHGPHAKDTKGYLDKYITEHGSEQDLRALEYYNAIRLARGTVGEIRTHSHIMGAWVHYGLFGLIFFIYFLWHIIVFVRKNISSIPQWYGFFATAIAPMVWSVFFNPYGSRSAIPLLMVCMLFAKAIARGRMRLPYGMEIEARKCE